MRECALAQYWRRTTTTFAKRPTTHVITHYTTKRTFPNRSLEADQTTSSAEYRPRPEGDEFPRFGWKKRGPSTFARMLFQSRATPPLAHTTRRRLSHYNLPRTTTATATTTSVKFSFSIRRRFASTRSSSQSKSKSRSSSNANANANDPGNSKNKSHPQIPFFFPSRPNATPHEIFQLPKDASQADIKARYYELAKIYHPDSPHMSRVPAATRNKRFYAIAAAYETLRKLKPSAAAPSPASRSRPTSSRPRPSASSQPPPPPPPPPHPHPHPHTSDEALYDLLRRRARMGGVNVGGWTSSGSGHDHGRQWTFPWKTTLFLGFVMFVAEGIRIEQEVLRQRVQEQGTPGAQLAQARAEARTFGLENRRWIRERVREGRWLEAEAGAEAEVSTPGGNVEQRREDVPREESEKE
ncbi:hypothetical protein F5I97DRAFT_459435 [Phlebopus sp. FC_14]|nr:hypothetical protein F5I97DRAFT_459435 [Phlebopus sp. FC_14]